MCVKVWSNYFVLLRLIDSRLVIFFHLSQVNIGIVTFRCGARASILWLALRLSVCEYFLVRVIEKGALSNIIRIFVPPFILLLVEDCLNIRCEALACDSISFDEVE